MPMAARPRRRDPVPAGAIGTAPALLAAASCLLLAAGAPRLARHAAAIRAARAQTRSAVSAATAFLRTLDPQQRACALLPFDPGAMPVVARFGRDAPDAPVREIDPATAAPRQRGKGMGPPGGFAGERFGMAIWTNFPISDVPRRGLPLGALSATQRAAAMTLLQTLLSPAGYRKVRDIMRADQVLADTGTPFASGRDAYVIGVFGEPDPHAPWMVAFGGHHLGLNLVIAGRHAAMTPTLTGAQPTRFEADGETVRVLAGENDKAFALLDALDPAQRRRAVLERTVTDLVRGPDNPDGAMPPEGLPGSAMSPRQRALLLELIGEWAGMIHPAHAAERLKEIEAGLDRTRFCWSGPVAREPGWNGAAYVRIQGPRLLIEFAPQAVGGDKRLHVHTVYRDPTSPYGWRFIAR